MIDNNIPEGSIVNVSSISGKNGNFGQVNYSASKAAVIGLTKTVAKEMAKHNIRWAEARDDSSLSLFLNSFLSQLAFFLSQLFSLNPPISPRRCNAVIPGFIDTPMVESVPEKIQMIMQMLIPLARKGNPEEVAEAILFLATSKSSYITGTTIDVTGGLFM